MKKGLFLLLLSYLAVILEASAFYHWGMTAMAPAILIVLVAETGLNDGWVSAGIMGLLCGIAMDLTLGMTGFAYTLTLTVTGVLAGSRRFAMRNRFLPVFAFPAAAWAASVLYSLIVMYILGGCPAAGRMLRIGLAASLVLTEVCAWPMFILLQKTVGKWGRIERNRRGEGVSRSVYFLMDR